MSPPQPRTADTAEQRFRALYADVHADVLRFVRRRFDDAPRRLDAQRAWVFGIARNCLLTARRGSGRREALAVRVTDAAADAGALTTTPHDDVVAGLDLAAAWRRLAPAEQEVLALTVFEDLTSAQAALVLGTTPTGYRLRLMRARRALRSRLADGDDAAEPAPRPATDALEATR